MAKSQAESLKEQGNVAMKKDQPAEAILHYTHAVKLDPNNHVLYSNRSLAFLKLDQYYLAREDASQTIKLQPNWPKGFFRKGEVEFKAGHYSMALMSYKQALLLDPTDESVLSAISRTNKEIIKERKIAAKQPIFFTAGGAGVGLLIVLADQYLTISPKIDNIILQGLLIISFAVVGFGISKAYRHLVDSQRASLLEPPVDLLSEMGQTSPKKADADNNYTTQNAHRRGGTASARQRYRKGKS